MRYPDLLLAMKDLSFMNREWKGAATSSVVESYAIETNVECETARSMYNIIVTSHALEITDREISQNTYSYTPPFTYGSAAHTSGFTTIITHS